VLRMNGLTLIIASLLDKDYTSLLL
jgi:hypothetical protein